jgi:hypothetical protein
MDIKKENKLKSQKNMRYQSIEKAPRDGTFILAYDVMSNAWKMAFYDKLSGEWMGDHADQKGPNPLDATAARP